MREYARDRSGTIWRTDGRRIGKKAKKLARRLRVRALKLRQRREHAQSSAIDETAAR